VISRTSVLEYRDTPKNLQEIAGELGVGHVLEGSVRKSGNRVRVTAQLIDADRDQHLWAEQYDGELTAENIFDIQGDVAGKIAAALRSELSPEEAERIEARPTGNLEAYDYYLRGLQLQNRGFSRETLERAIEMLERAVALDPEFAEAHAAISTAHSEMWWFYYDRTRERLQQSAASLARAREIAPDLPRGLVAEGWYHYHGHLDYVRALKAFEAALEALPGDPDPAYGIAAINRRLGDMETSVDYFKRAHKLDPRSAIMAAQIGETLGLLRRFDEAHPYSSKASTLSPAFTDPYPVLRRGGPHGQRTRCALGRNRGRSDRAPCVGLDLAGGAGGPVRGGAGTPARRARRPGSRSHAELVVGQPVQVRAQGAMARCAPRAAGAERERAHWEASATILTDLLRERPEDSRLHSSLGIAFAGLGRKEDAIQAGKLGVALLPIAREAWRGAYRLEDLARVYAGVGELDAAVAELEVLLDRPTPMTVGRLRLEPWWRPLHGHPRFEALLVEHEPVTE
jgi:serine/threonine-protein kinase